MMIVYSDSIEFAAGVLPEDFAVRRKFASAIDAGEQPLVVALLGDSRDVYSFATEFPGWSHLFLTADSARSQCDQLIALSRNGYAIPDHTACLARTGTGFRGFKGRSWSAAPGNVHLAVHFAPGCAIERFEVAFTILAALSVVETIDDVPGLRHRAGIRWVNDIMIEEAKVGGVLAYTQTLGQTVTSAILGIGLNVGASPTVEPTPFVPTVCSLSEMTVDGASVSLRFVLGRLLSAIERNYAQLLQSGYRPLLERYRRRSTVTGKDCTLCTEESDVEPDVIAAGRLVAIGEGLELYLEGCERPFTRGRLLAGLHRAAGPAGH